MASGEEQEGGMRLFNPDSTHWYRRDGEPLHSVPSVKGDPRPTTLRDARKLGLLPSVTNVLGVIAKPELTAWLPKAWLPPSAMAALPCFRFISGDGEAQAMAAVSMTCP